MHPTFYPTHISFIPSQLIFPFLNKAIKNLTLKIQGQGELGQSFKVKHPIDSHPFGSMSIHPLIAMISFFLNLTFKIQGQTHS